MPFLATSLGGVSHVTILSTVALLTTTLFPSSPFLTLDNTIPTHSYDDNFIPLSNTFQQQYSFFNPSATTTHLKDDKTTSPMLFSSPFRFHSTSNATTSQPKCLCDPMEMNGRPFSRFLGENFKICAYSVKDFVAFALGLTNIVIWLFTQAPQLYRIYKNKSSGNLSLGFLILWCIGNVCNLIGSLITAQQILFYSAVYFLSMDLLLLTLYAYYNTCYKWRKKRQNEEEAAEMERLRREEEHHENHDSIFLHEDEHNDQACLNSEANPHDHEHYFDNGAGCGVGDDVDVAPHSPFVIEGVGTPLPSPKNIQTTSNDINTNLCDLNGALHSNTDDLHPHIVVSPLATHPVNDDSNPLTPGSTLRGTPLGNEAIDNRKKLEMEPLSPIPGSGVGSKSKKTPKTPLTGHSDDYYDDNSLDQPADSTLYQSMNHPTYHDQIYTTYQPTTTPIVESECGNVNIIDGDKVNFAIKQHNNWTPGSEATTHLTQSHSEMTMPTVGSIGNDVSPAMTETATIVNTTDNTNKNNNHHNDSLSSDNDLINQVNHMGKVERHNTMNQPHGNVKNHKNNHHNNNVPHNNNNNPHNHHKLHGSGFDFTKPRNSNVIINNSVTKDDTDNTPHHPHRRHSNNNSTHINTTQDHQQQQQQQQQHANSHTHHTHHTHSGGVSGSTGGHSIGPSAPIGGGLHTTIMMISITIIAMANLMTMTDAKMKFMEIFVTKDGENEGFEQNQYFFTKNTTLKSSHNKSSFNPHSITSSNSLVNNINDVIEPIEFVFDAQQDTTTTDPTTTTTDPTTDPTPLPQCDDTPFDSAAAKVIGIICVWVSGMMYFVAPIPQCITNYKEKNVYGLSFSFFVFQFIANMCYGLSILVPDTTDFRSLEFWRDSFAYVLGSIGSNIFGIIVMVQFYLYPSIVSAEDHQLNNTPHSIHSTPLVNNNMTGVDGSGAGELLPDYQHNIDGVVTVHGSAHYTIASPFSAVGTGTFGLVEIDRIQKQENSIFRGSQSAHHHHHGPNGTPYSIHRDYPPGSARSMRSVDNGLNSGLPRSSGGVVVGRSGETQSAGGQQQHQLSAGGTNYGLPSAQSAGENINSISNSGETLSAGGHDYINNNRMMRERANTVDMIHGHLFTPSLEVNVTGNHIININDNKDNRVSNDKSSNHVISFSPDDDTSPLSGPIVEMQPIDFHHQDGEFGRAVQQQPSAEQLQQSHSRQLHQKYDDVMIDNDNNDDVEEANEEEDEEPPVTELVLHISR